MKYSIILDRTELKDYVDLYWILKKYSINEIIIAVRNKFPEINPGVVLKGMTYTQDIEESGVNFKPGF